MLAAVGCRVENLEGVVVFLVVVAVDMKGWVGELLAAPAAAQASLLSWTGQ